MYRCDATSVSGFIQQLAVQLLTSGYVLYVPGTIPEKKEPAITDRNIITRYGLEISKATRCRRRKQGIASVHYLRHGRFFLLLATEGAHPFLEAESRSLKDARKSPIRFAGYSVSLRDGHAHVRIEEDTYRAIRQELVSLALYRSAATLERKIKALPFEPYAPVRLQLSRLVDLVNRKRRTAGLAPLSRRCVKVRRKSVKPFAPKCCRASAPAAPATGVLEATGSARGEDTRAPRSRRQRGEAGSSLS